MARESGENEKQGESHEEEFFHAAQRGDLTRVKELFKLNSKLISVRPFPNRQTPLHAAAESGCREVVDFLLANNADADAVDRDVNTPLSLAEKSSAAKDVVELLQPRTFGYVSEAFCLAVSDGNLAEAKKWLKQRPSLVFTTDNKGRTPLDLAVEGDHKEVAEFLIANKANVMAWEGKGKGVTPLHVAAGRSTAMVKLLIAKGANVNARTSGGATPLFLCNSVENAKVLLARGAKINARDKEGWTALDMAVYEGQGHEHMIDFLRRRGGREYVPKPENPFSQQGSWLRNTMLAIFRRFLHF